MAGGCSLFEKKDKLEVKGIYIIFRMCACEGIDALRKTVALFVFNIVRFHWLFFQKESPLRRIFGGNFGGNNCRYRKIFNNISING